MRRMIDEEKPPHDLWDIKLIPGGLIDLEFIAQVAVLTGKFTGKPGTTATVDVLANLAPDYADAGMRENLMQAFAFYLSLTQIIRLCLTGHFDKEDVPPGLADLLLAVTAMPDFSVMEAQLRDMSETVRDDFDRIIGGKAG